EARPSFAEIVRVLRAMAEGPQAAAKPDGAQVRAASSSQERRSRDPAASARRAASPCPRVHPCFGASPRPGVLPQWPQQQQQQWQHQQQHQWQQQQQQQLLQQQQLQQQQEQQQQQQEHQGQKQPELELFALECIRAQGVDCQMLAPERRRIVHGLSREAGNVPRALEKKGPLQVGRAFQTPLFEESWWRRASPGAPPSPGSTSRYGWTPRKGEALATSSSRTAAATARGSTTSSCRGEGSKLPCTTGTW
ncbi:unnamed protein product, partial [Effrenium voratum]